MVFFGPEKVASESWCYRWSYSNLNLTGGREGPLSNSQRKSLVTSGRRGDRAQIIAIAKLSLTSGQDSRVRILGCRTASPKSCARIESIVILERRVATSAKAAVMSLASLLHSGVVLRNFGCPPRDENSHRKSVAI